MAIEINRAGQLNAHHIGEVVRAHIDGPLYIEDKLVSVRHVATTTTTAGSVVYLKFDTLAGHPQGTREFIVDVDQSVSVVDKSLPF